MTTQVAEVDELVSLAHRVEGDVRVELRLPGSSLAAGAAQVRLGAGKRRIVVPGELAHEGEAVKLTFTAPGNKLGRAAWRLAVKVEGSSGFVRVRARLMAPRGLPVALLPGPAPTTRLPAPAPRQRAATPLARRLPPPVRAALSRGRRALRGARGG